MELGVAGTAVGIASLGIQVCEKLHLYYAGWRDCPDDVASNVKAIESLRRTFELFEPILADHNLPSDIKQQVEQCLTACTNGVNTLKKKFDKFGSPDKVKAATLRLEYPFRRSTLVKLSERVGKLLGHLDLALQVLEVGLQSRSFTGVWEARKEINSVASSIEAVRESVQLVRTEQQSTLKAIKSGTAELASSLDKLNISSQHIATDWIEALDVMSTHDQACRRRHPSTGQWLLDSAKYLAWKSDPGPERRVWIHGMSGCCKTVLSSIIIEDLRSFCDREADRTLAYFYFTFSDQRKQSWDALLRTLVLQLSEGKPAVDALSTAFERASSTPPTTTLLETTLKQILAKSCENSGHVNVVIDALDECPDDLGTRGSVCEALADLTDSFGQLHILVTSRRCPDIEHFMEKWEATSVKISPNLVDIDIKSFVVHELETGIAFSGLEERSKDLIATWLSEKASGMFRWAALHLDRLRTMKNKTHYRIEQALKQLPPTLAMSYEKILRDLDGHCARLAIRGLTKLALGPLTMDQVAECMCIDPNANEVLVEQDRVTTEGMSEILAGFIDVELESPTCYYCTIRRGEIQCAHRGPGKYYNAPCCTRCKIKLLFSHKEADIGHKRFLVRLAHGSVRDYLLSGSSGAMQRNQIQTTSQQGQCYISRAMLAYLRVTDATRREKRCYKKEYHLLTVVIHPESLTAFGRKGECPCGDEQDHLVLEKAFVESASLGHWLFKGGGQLHVDTSHRSPLVAACVIGFRNLVYSMLEDGASVNGIDERSCTLLHVAIARGDGEFVEDLLVRHADVHQRQETNNTALHFVAATDYVDIADMLMAAGADASLWNDDGETPLYMAVTAGQHKMVRRLLERGVNVNVVNANGDTALLNACFHHWPGMIQTLLSYRPDLEHCDS
ncbi:hypothetical protein LTR27_005694 [Elasticomyces elasticus]|nr:hypothetical protein LTR27_005694 [Elasticomyces elasticus]